MHSQETEHAAWSAGNNEIANKFWMVQYKEGTRENLNEVVLLRFNNPDAVRSGAAGVVIQSKLHLITLLEVVLDLRHKEGKERVRSHSTPRKK